MKTAFLALTLLVASMAGCFGDSGGEDHSDTTTTTGSATSGTTTTTPPTPNVPPTLMLKVTDEGGNVTNTTLAGGNLTFDPAGSTDPDGTLTDLAIIIDDGRGTPRFAVFRTEGKQNQATATFNFANPGPVKVTLNGLDDDRAPVQLSTMVYVNQYIAPASFQMNIATEDLPVAEACVSPTAGPDGANPGEFAGWQRFPFDVQANATYVVAKVREGQATIGLCDPTGAAISDEADEEAFVATNPDVVLMKPVGTDTYYVGALSGFVAQDVGVEIIVHYDPRPAEVSGFQ